MKELYLNDWKESGRKGMLVDFGIDESYLEGVEILLASYTYEEYSGSTFVLFRKDDKLFEVVGGHCSCYGLSESSYSGESETQWKPEDTTIEALKHRLAHDTYMFDGCKTELKEVLDGL